MHRNVGAPLMQRDLEFFHKQALAAHFGQTAVQNLVPLCGHAQQLHAAAHGLQQGFDVFGLPQRQTALAGGNDDRGLLGLGHGGFPEKKFDPIKMKSIGNFVSPGDASMMSRQIDTLLDFVDFLPIHGIHP
jgi:hypothetical protein